MRRTQIQLDDKTYAALRRRAYEQGRSISALARELLAQSLGARRPTRRLTLKDFPFVGVGSSHQGPESPVSERHDEALVDAILRPEIM